MLDPDPRPLPPDVSELDVRTGGDERVFEGIGVAPGIAIAAAVAFANPSYRTSERQVPLEDVEAEVERLETAMERAERELQKIATLAQEKLGDSSAEIFYAHILVLHDPALREDAVALVREERLSAASAVQTVLDKVRLKLECSRSERIRERAGDLVDVQNRLLRILQQSKAFSAIERDRIVVAEDLTAADLLLFSRRNVLGCAMDYGGPTSHVSLMARALGIPAVVSLHGFAKTIEGGETVILDGFTGRVILDPTEETIEAYRERRQRYREGLEARRELIPLPAETRDGVRIALRANVELQEELALLGQYGAEGIGLFRTEMLLLARGRPIGEEEQAGVYRAAIAAARPHPTTFRLIDLGGDKFLPLSNREHNPFLGWRGVRVLLDKPDLLRPQLRALFRAATEGPAQLLLPMVSSLQEVRRIREVIEEAKNSLERDGLPHADALPLGVMVEIPSAALMADRFALDVDFLSIGSNDLTQFTLAVDRGNDLVAPYYRELHPAVLSLIHRVAKAGARAGVPVSLCGEMASNPKAVPLLVGLGLRELSLSPAFLLDVKRVIRAMGLDEAEGLAHAALEQPDAQSVQTLVDVWLQEHTPELAPYFDGV